MNIILKVTFIAIENLIRFYFQWFQLPFLKDITTQQSFILNK
jgi:hypothetical protein